MERSVEQQFATADKFRQNQIIYFSPGSYTFVVPSVVFQIYGIVIGGGGSGSYNEGAPGFTAGGGIASNGGFSQGSRAGSGGVGGGGGGSYHVNAVSGAGGNGCALIYW